MDVYLAAGIPRSGSTWLYNALRHVLPYRYARVQSAWVDDYRRSYDSGANALIIKLHAPHDEWRARASRIFTSHRDLRDIVVSGQDMGWGKGREWIIDFAKAVREYHDYWSQWSALDIPYERIVANDVAAVTDIAAACGIRLPPGAAKLIADRLSKLSGVDESKDETDMQTQMHRRHRFDGRPGRFAGQLEKILSTEIRHQHGDWLARMHYDL